MSKPGVSVIMSVYNTTLQHLAAAIESILKQTYRDFEFVIVDDGSDAQTAQILEHYTKQDKHIMLIHNTHNLGLTKSLNKAIKYAHGNYIARMDADDISLPYRLQRQLKFLKLGQFDLVGARATHINERGHKSGTTSPTPQGTMRSALIRGNFFVHGALFCTRQVFNERYNEQFIFAQDYEFLLRLAAKGYRLGFDNTPLLYYRLGSNTLSQQRAKQQELFALKARWLAISRYGYGYRYFPYLARAAAAWALPLKLKRILLPAAT